MAHQTPNDPVQKVVLAVSIVALLTAVVVLVNSLINTIGNNSTKGLEDTSMQTAVAEENLKPVGEVNAVDKSIAKAPRSGEAVYQAVCTSCHAAGVLEAPKLEKADWVSRMGGGLAGLVKVATEGKGNMPAKGGDPTLTEEELTNAIIYMTDKAGYNLGSGEAAAPAAAQETTTEQAPAVEVATPTEPTPPTPPSEPATPAEPAQAEEAPAAGTEQEVAPTTAEEPAQAAAAGGSAFGASTDEGKSVYKSLCFSCHDTGVAGSPKLGDKEAWAPRIATGADAVYATSLNGKGAMPAKGGNPALSDDAVKAAVDYMINESK